MTNQDCTLSDAELIELAHEQLSEMCKTGGKSFTMRIPANVNKDTDLIYAELISRFERLSSQAQPPRVDEGRIVEIMEKHKVYEQVIQAPSLDYTPSAIDHAKVARHHAMRGLIKDIVQELSAPVQEQPTECCGFGEYTCQVPTSLKDSKGRTIHVDKCLKEAIEALNAAGLKTTACCCGHGIVNPHIAIEGLKNPHTPCIETAYPDTMPQRGWKDVNKTLPNCWEDGEWDGKRSDFVIVELDTGVRKIARLYKGIIDGHEFTDWVGTDDYDFGGDMVVKWCEIPDNTDSHNCDDAELIKSWTALAEDAKTEGYSDITIFDNQADVLINALNAPFAATSPAQSEVTEGEIMEVLYKADVLADPSKLDHVRREAIAKAIHALISKQNKED